MHIDIVSVFPQYFETLTLSLLGKAREKGLISVEARNLRDWTCDVHHAVDDTPCGGGAGMVMKPAVWGECLDELLGLEASDISENAGYTTFCQAVQSGRNVKISRKYEAREGTVLIFPNPSAPLFTQNDAKELSQKKHIIFGCGRYEGYDARIPRYYETRGVDVREYSIGDYVLNGGEAAVSVMLEAITRLIPGFMGNPDSIVEESYSGEDSLLEHAQFTKPARWRGMDVPEIYMSGHHAKIEAAKRSESLIRTSNIRPDLVERIHCEKLSEEDRKTLISQGWDVSGEHPRKISAER
ncbi:MAG: tRNA (guanosine(37)-N1)-methyltransferase TrmD [Bifidobacteriaceae bacterium]|nr:tRNA (guanosine(37)-N1)-methyltransferase TrmD [Bifidobacteriaceae bacterium]